MPFQIPSGFGSIQPNPPPSMLETYMALKKQRMAEQLQQATISHYASEDQTAHQNADTEAQRYQAAASEAQQKETDATTEKRKKEAAALLRTGNFAGLQNYRDIIAPVLGTKPDDPKLNDLMQPPADPAHKDAPMQLADALDPAGAEKFDTVTQGVGPDGKPMMAQIGTRGTEHPVTGIQPKPDKPDKPNEPNWIWAIPPGASEAERMTDADAARRHATPYEKGDNTDVPDVPQPDAQGDAKDERKSLWQQAEVSTGIKGAAKAGAAAVSGQFGITTNSDAVQGRRDLKAAMGDVIAAMANNKRYPVAEMKQIADRYPLEPSLGNPATTMHDDMQSMAHQFAAQFQQRLEYVAAGKGDKKSQLDAAKQATVLHNFLLRMGVPPSSEPNAKFLYIEGDHSVWQRKDGTLFKYDGIDANQ